MCKYISAYVNAWFGVMLFSQKHADETGNMTSNRSTTPLPDAGANGVYLGSFQQNVSISAW